MVDVRIKDGGSALIIVLVSLDHHLVGFKSKSDEKGFR